MPRKQTAAKKRAIAIAQAASPQTYPAAWHGAPAKPPMSTRDEEAQLAQAILASKACVMQTDTYEASLARALELSQAEAAQEAEDTEALRLAMSASLAEAEEKCLALGLKTAPRLGASRFHGIAHEVTVTAATSSHSAVVEEEAVAETTLLAGTAVSRILKVTYGQDMRRLHVQWPSAAQSRDILGVIQNVIEDCFGLPSGSAAPPVYFLKYRDDEGDLCTLVEQTLRDFLDMSIQCASWKIYVETNQDQRLRKTELELPEEVDGCSCTDQDPHGCSWVHDDQGKQLESLQEDLFSSEDQSVRKKESASLVDFSIATPPSTPRCDSPTSCSDTIEDDYDSMWALVETDTHL